MNFNVRRFFNSFIIDSSILHIGVNWVQVKCKQFICIVQEKERKIAFFLIKNYFSWKGREQDLHDYRGAVPYTWLRKPGHYGSLTMK